MLERVLGEEHECTDLIRAIGLVKRKSPVFLFSNCLWRYSRT